MNIQRKKIVISEITYWKKSKLLPEHYCDFLISLYSNGYEIDGNEADLSKSVLSIEKRKLKTAVSLLLLLAIVCSVSLFKFVNYPAITFGLSAVALCILLLFAIRGSCAEIQPNAIFIHNKRIYIFSNVFKIMDYFFRRAVDDINWYFNCKLSVMAICWSIFELIVFHNFRGSGNPINSRLCTRKVLNS